jgi:PncC family amidohydrolase
MQGLMELAGSVAERLRVRGETLSIAESSSGGLVAAALLAQPGASAFFLGGAVIYTGKAREALLGIRPADMVGMRASTEPYATLLAARVRERLETTWGLGETGAAGPSGNRYGDDAGHACIAVAGPVPCTRTLATRSIDRAANMRAFAAAALTLLRDAL